MEESLPVADLLKDLQKGKIHRVSGTAIYMSGKGSRVPTALLHNLKHNQVLHERVILLHVMTLDQPHVNPHEVLDYQDLGDGVHRATLRFGFADTPDVPDALKHRMPENARFQPGKATYFLGRETYGVGKKATFMPLLPPRISNCRPAEWLSLARKSPCDPWPTPFPFPSPALVPCRPSAAEWRSIMRRCWLGGFRLRNPAIC
jgi:hypothetical protein